MTEEEGIMELGGNIRLSGFSELDRANMVVVKKIVGNYAKRFASKAKKFEQLSLNLKTIGPAASHQFELHAKVIDDGKPIISQVTDYNLFFALDKALKKLEAEMS